MRIKVISVVTTEIDYGPYQPTWKIDPIDNTLYEVLASLNLGFNAPNQPVTTPFSARVIASRIVTEDD